MNITIGKNFIGYAASAVFALGAFFSVYNGLKLGGTDQALTLFISLFAIVAVFFNKRVLSYIALALMAFQTSMVVYGFFQFKENAANLFGSFGGNNELLSNFASAAVSQVTLEFGFFFMLVGTLGFAFYLVKNKSSDSAVSNDALQTKIDDIKKHALEVESKSDVMLSVEEKASEGSTQSSFNEALENEAVLKKQTSDVSTSHQFNENGRKESNVKTIALTAAIALIIGAGSMYAYHNYDNILSFATEQIDSETNQSSVEQSDLDDAINDYDNEKYASAFSKFEALAKNGNADAQNYLGYMYERGQGVKQDKAEAVAWYRKAADQGDAYAQNNLGWMYENGQGVKQDLVQAVAWYRKAAEQGHAYAQQNLGFFYYDDTDKPDYKLGVEWLTKACESGLSKSCSKISGAYLFGYGVEKNVEKAEFYLSEAGNKGDKDDLFMNGSTYYYGMLFEKDLDKAVHWFTKASDAGNDNASVILGELYTKGWNTKSPNFETAYEFFSKAAKNGNAEGQYNLALAYQKGRGVKENKEEAFKWYQKAASQGFAQAQHNLGSMYRDGVTVKKDLVKAFNLYSESSKQGLANSLANLGVMYFNGEGAKQDKVLALAYTLMAFEKKDADAQKNLSAIKASLNKAQIDEATQIAKSWKVGEPLPTESKTWKVSSSSDTKANIKQEAKENDDLARQETSTWISAISAKVRRAWIKESTENAVCYVYMRQTREGEVKEVRVKSCQGGASEAYKRSVELAVRRASPLPRAPSDEVFKEEIVFTFKP